MHAYLFVFQSLQFKLNRFALRFQAKLLGLPAERSLLTDTS
jgi:hypothetical protein